MEKEEEVVGAAVLLLLRTMQRHLHIVQQIIAMQQTLLMAYEDLKIVMQRKAALRRKRILKLHKLRRYCQISKNQEIIQIIRNPRCGLKTYLNVSRRVFQKLLNHIHYNRDHGWSGEIRLGALLFWLTSGATQTDIATLFKIPKTSIRTIIYQSLRKVASLASHFITFPKEEKLCEIGEGFAALVGNSAFVKVVGSIDQFQIPVKLTHSGNRQLTNLQFQAVCDHRGLFLDVYCGFPVSSNSGSVLRISNLYNRKLYPPPGYIIVGSELHPNISSPIGLVAPYSAPFRSQEEGNFNVLNGLASAIVGCAFEQLTNRWENVFSNTLECSYKHLPNIVGACAIIHNMCIREGQSLNFHYDSRTSGRYGDVCFRQVTHCEVSADDIRDQMARNAVRVNPQIFNLREHDYI